MIPRSLDPNRCCELVCPREAWGAFHSHQCQKKAVVERNGKWYCAQHDPEAIRVRDEAKRVQWEAESQRRSDADTKERRIHAAHEPLIRACQELLRQAESGDTITLVSLSVAIALAREGLAAAGRTNE